MPNLEADIRELEHAASLDDTQTFVGLVKEIKWELKTLDEFQRVIQLALNLSAPTAAEFVYDIAMRSHPESEGLEVFARLFTPQKRATKTSEANPTLQANRHWLKANREKYRGQWVALRDGHLLGIASSLEDLTRTLSDTSNTLLTRA